MTQERRLHQEIQRAADWLLFDEVPNWSTAGNGKLYNEINRIHGDETLAQEERERRIDELHGDWYAGLVDAAIHNESLISERLERELIKRFDNFTRATKDPRTAAVLTLAWATQRGRAR